MLTTIKSAILPAISIGICSCFIQGCQTVPQPKQQLIEQISYGSNSGRCTGYCINETQMTPSRITKIERSPAGDQAFPPQVTSSKVSHLKWQKILASINLDDFYALPERVGCPNCYDQGAYWLEIKTATQQHRVTYDPNQVPSQLTKIDALLFE